ncbi:MAG TPA: S-adenosylmethionine decarboxylase [Gemmatimonadaceae bacterium]|nr:S-adenosylmethionine decarboxylase [Gemmatimonadaceae bacterium]
MNQYTHLIADFSGVPADELRNTDLLAGLLVAAAGAAGLMAVGAPIVRRLPSDLVSGVLLLDGCHMSVHAVPADGLLMLDVLALASYDASKALDVFARRLSAREIRSEQRSRG